MLWSYFSIETKMYDCHIHNDDGNQQNLRSIFLLTLYLVLYFWYTVTIVSVYHSGHYWLAELVLLMFEHWPMITWSALMVQYGSKSTITTWLHNTTRLTRYFDKRKIERVWKKERLVVKKFVMPIHSFALALRTPAIVVKTKVSARSKLQMA